MAQQWTPDHIRRLLIERDWSVRQFAQALGVCERTVRNWLSGAHPPSPANGLRLERLCRQDEEGEPVDRRSLLGAAGRTPLLMAFGGPRTPSADLDAGLVGDGLYRLYATVPPAALLLHARLHAGLHPSAEAYGFAGWLALVADLGGESYAWFAGARDLAAEQGDARGQALALAGLSACVQGTPLAGPLVEKAQDLAADADPWTQLLVELRAAVEHAFARQAGRCHGALWRAERLIERADPQAAGGFYTPEGRFRSWTTAYVASDRAKCEVLLRSGARTLAAIADAQSTGLVLSGRALTMQTIHRGHAHRLLDQPEPAAAALAEAWRRARETGHGLGLSHTLKARAAFPQQWAPLACVRELDEVLRS